MLGKNLIGLLAIAVADYVRFAEKNDADETKTPVEKQEALLAWLDDAAKSLPLSLVGALGQDSEASKADREAVTVANLAVKLYPTMTGVRGEQRAQAAVSAARAILAIARAGA